jgi:hypothetical protein
MYPSGEPIPAFPWETDALYSVTAERAMDCGILVRGDDGIRRSA